MIIAILETLALVAAGWFCADFLSGVLHWMEDRYGSPRWPLVGGAIRDTIRHHRRPRYMLTKPFLARNWRVFAIAGLGLCAFALLGWVNAFTLTLVFGAAVSNEIHAAAHRTTRENGRLVRALQRSGLIQSPLHHAAHHRDLKNRNFCVLTDWLNPVLEQARFWRRLELVVRVVSRERPRRDPTVRRRQRRLWPRRILQG